MTTFSKPLQIQCPACRQPFVAQVEQIIDVGADPQSKGRLLSGNLNFVACPKCGSSGLMAVPLLYHDPEHELLLVFVPLELNLDQTKREQMIGSLTRTLMSAIPSEARKGYLFNPQPVLSMDSLIERVLTTDGVSPEILEAQRQRSTLLSRLLSASPAELKPLVDSNDDKLDSVFFQMLAAMIDAARRANRQEEVQSLIRLRNQLLPLARWSRERGLTAESLDAQQARVDLIERFLATDPAEWTALARQHDAHLDYTFFQLLAGLIEEAPDEVADLATRLRDQLLEASTVGQRTRAGRQAVSRLESAAKSAGGLTRPLLLDEIVRAESDHVVQALALAASPLLDYSFFILMADRIDAAQEAGNPAEAHRLEVLREKLVKLTEQWEQARRKHAEQVYREIDTLLQAPDRVAAIQELLPAIDQLFLSLLAGRADSVRQAGNIERSAQLEALLNQILHQVRASAPPEIQLVNDLLEIEDQAGVAAALVARRSDLTPTAISVMQGLLADLQTEGEATIADRLQFIVKSAQSLLAEDVSSEAEG